MDVEDNILLKIILEGTQLTGKSWILQQYMDQNVCISYPTIGVEFRKKSIQISDKTVQLQVWDNSGKEKYKSLTQDYYADSKGAILVYNITNQQSFKLALEKIQLIKTSADPGCVLMLVGNFLDLVEEDPVSRAISVEMAQKVASTNNMMFMEVSAKQNYKIEEMFTELASKIIQQLKKIDKLQPQQVPALQN